MDLRHSASNYVRKKITVITLGKNNLKNVPCFADTMYIFALYFFLNPVSRVRW